MDELSNNSAGSSYDGVYSSYAERQIISAVLLVASIVGLFGNALVIAAVVLSKKLWNATYMFVLNLSIADFVTCAYVIPINTAILLSTEHMPALMPFCTVAGFLYTLCFGCSINNLLCIAINRYAVVSVSKATYSKLFSQRRTAVAIMLTWLVPTCAVLIPILTGCLQLGFDKEYLSCVVDTQNSSEGCILGRMACLVPIQFCLISWSCVMIFYRIHTHAKRVQHLAPIEMQVYGDQRMQQPNLNNKLQVEVTKNLLFVVGAFVVCILPYSVCVVLSFTLTNTAIVKKIVPTAFAFLSINSCLNPMIYGLKHPHFKTVFRCIVRGKFAEIPDRIWK
ncbi:melatonin receptor type 1C-like [Patiria miniata]|uniref:G-protein coupled receptors family 1 profile domain-containing protein n=1 Tax=Patiria miniata TaxID=46514 RepID=A0A914AJC0_PATMI|nr:melatonin receptor type 1C-like [Patiria miniata]